MALYLSYFAFGALLVALGFALSHLFLRRALRRSFDQRQVATERQLTALVAEFQALEARLNSRLDAQAETLQLQTVAAPEPTVEAAQELSAAIEPAAEPQIRTQPGSELSPETMAVLTAAVTAFLGKKVRVLSARLLESPHEMANAWSQQGRVFVQASHNLRARG